MRSIYDMTVGDYVKVDGKKEKIVSIYGLNKQTGSLAKPSEGGFGVVTESGRTVTMWEAQSYYKASDVEHGGVA